MYFSKVAMHFLNVFFLLPSPLLHHTIPAGENLRLTVYRCITASICLTSSPASLHPHERELRIKKRGEMEEGTRERKREVCLCN